jgi:hypothetical protein
VTVDTKHIADLTDVAAIRLECRKCGFAYVWAPRQPLGQIPFSCKACGVVWFSDTSASLEREALHGFSEAITTLSKHQEAPGYLVRFEFPAPK